MRCQLREKLHAPGVGVMLRVQSVLADAEAHPPMILVHGAANSARVWQFWQTELASRGWSSHALDLRGHGAGEPIDLSETRMSDYAADVMTLARRLRYRPALVGWSMGGLAAMMAAQSGDAVACVGLAPSIPTRFSNASGAIRSGVFGAEEYGIVDRDPERQPMMPDLEREERLVALESLGLESRRARDERTAGIVIEKLDCPLAVVTGTSDVQWPHARYQGFHLPRTHIEIPGASHWGLVLNRRVMPELVSAVVDWLAKATGGTQHR